MRVWEEGNGCGGEQGIGFLIKRRKQDFCKHLEKLQCFFILLLAHSGFSESTRDSQLLRDIDSECFLRQVQGPLKVLNSPERTAQGNEYQLSLSLPNIKKKVQGKPRVILLA